MVTIGGLVIVLMTQMGEDISKRYVGLATVSVCLSPCLPLCVCVCVCVCERERECVVSGANSLCLKRSRVLRSLRHYQQDDWWLLKKCFGMEYLMCVKPDQHRCENVGILCYWHVIYIFIACTYTYTFVCLSFCLAFQMCGCLCSAVYSLSRSCGGHSATTAVVSCWWQDIYITCMLG